MHLKGIRPSDHPCYDSIYIVFLKCQIIEAQSILVVAQDQGGFGKEGGGCGYKRVAWEILRRSCSALACGGGGGYIDLHIYVNCTDSFLQYTHVHIKLIKFQKSENITRLYPNQFLGCNTMPRSYKMYPLVEAGEGYMTSSVLLFPTSNEPTIMPNKK